MFANSIKIENDSSFLENIRGVSVDSYKIHKDKVVISGQLDVDDDFFRNFKTIVRYSFSDLSLQKEEYLTPSQFVFQDLELLIDEVAISQRILTSKKFTVQVPVQPNLSNFSVYASFVTSIDDTNFINYYNKEISLVWSSELVRAGVVSDKTYVPLLMDDKYILNQIGLPPEEQTINTSELFYTLDSNNNFYSTAFFNLKNLFTNKIRFPNLINIPEFFDYFRKNYLFRVDATLSNGSFRIPLNVNQEQNVFVSGETNNVAFSMNYDNIDIQKFDGGLITVDLNYQEDSVKYVQEVILPFVSEVSRSLRAGVSASSIINVILYYKVLKEANSIPDSFQNLIRFKQINDQIPLSNEDVESLKQYALYISSVFVKNISDVSAYNLFNTKLSISLEQPVYLKNDNASLNFFEINSNNSFFPTYRLDNFRNLFTREVIRFFGSTNVVIEDTTLDFNSLNITFAPSKAFISSTKVLENKINFPSYDTKEISEDELDSSSFEFSKICSYFDLGKDISRVLQYDFENLLDRDLFLNGVSFEEVDRKIVPPSTFNTIKRDDSRSQVQFPSGLRDEVCIDSTVRTATSNATQQQTSREIPDNLYNNIVTNNKFIDSNFYADSYSNVSISNSTPIQVVYPAEQFKNRTNTLFKNTEPVVANGKLFSTFFMNFRVIGKIEFLDVLTEGMFSTWKPLTINSGTLPVGKKILCKVSFYKNSEYDIKETTFDAFSIYNRYFFLEAA